jgi:hypothetical protein
MPRFLKDYWACRFLSFQSDQITKSANSLPRVDFNTRQSVCHVIDKRHWTKTVLLSLLSLNDIWLVLHLARLFPSVFSRNLPFPILRDWMFCVHQPSILFSQNILAPVTNQSAVLFSRNKSVPAFSHNPAGQVRLGSMPLILYMNRKNARVLQRVLSTQVIIYWFPIAYIVYSQKFKDTTHHKNTGESWKVYIPIKS